MGGCNCSKGADDMDSVNLISDRSPSNPSQQFGSNKERINKNTMVNKASENASIDLPSSLFLPDGHKESYLVQLKRNKVLVIDLPDSPEKRGGQEQGDVDWAEDAFRGSTNSKHAGPAILVRSHRTFHYEGNKKGNVRDGYGVQTYPDGSTYEGEFRKNKFQGRGKLTLPNGDWYDGNSN